MILTPDVYWKLTALMERYNAQAVDFHTKLTAARQQAFKDAGLDPSVNYTLSDADYSATPQAPQAQA